MKFEPEDFTIIENCKQLLVRGKWELTGSQAKNLAATLIKLDDLADKMREMNIPRMETPKPPVKKMRKKRESKNK